MNHPVKPKKIFCTFLVVLYLCLYVKCPKIVFNFRTKIADSVKNYAHHGKKQPHQEVEDGYIFVNIL